jgi:RHS repeat-associated protein
VDTVASTSLTHDSKGNLTQGNDALQYAWDADNMLKEATVPAMSTVGIEGTHTYQYDALGRRVAKTVQNGMSSTTTVFVHADKQVLAEYPSGTAASSPDKEYVYGTYVDELIALIDRTALGSTGAGSDEIFYAHQSHQYHVIALTDASGNVFERYAYTPYGDLFILNASGTSAKTASDIGNVVTYTGQRFDPEAGLYHFKARPLQARLGRFISRDPLQYIDGASLYQAYFVPSFLDPFGFDSWSQTTVYGRSDHVMSITFSGSVNQFDGQKQFSGYGGQDVAVAFKGDSDACFCKNIRFIQAVRDTEKYKYSEETRYSDLSAYAGAGHSANDPSSVGWRLDTHPAFPGSITYRGGGDRTRPGAYSSPATMFDAPSPSGVNPTNWSTSKLEFETCAVCDSPTSSQDGEVFGCIRWSETYKKGQTTRSTYWGWSTISDTATYTEVTAEYSPIPSQNFNDLLNKHKWR